jgi:cytochrome b involved in lipid metabolism
MHDYTGKKHNKGYIESFTKKQDNKTTASLKRKIRNKEIIKHNNDEEDFIIVGGINYSKKEYLNGDVI